MIESFWSSMQRELLDIRTWPNPDVVASAIFEWIEAWYNPRRRHASLGNLFTSRRRSPTQHRRRRGMIATPDVSREAGQAPRRGHHRQGADTATSGAPAARHDGR